MNEVLIKTMRRANIFSVFLAGLALSFLLGIFFWGYTVLKTIYMFDELADQTFNNKEAILSKTVNSKAMENLSQPVEIAAPRAPSEKVDKALLSVNTVTEVEAKPITYNKKISQQTSFSKEQHQSDPERAVVNKELQIEATTKHDLIDSAENSITPKISTFTDNTPKNYKSLRAAELYRQITVNQQQAKEENDSQANSINSNDAVETLAADSINSVADQNEKDINDRVVTLRLEIERLNERIESGLSDSDYDYYLQLNSAEIVIHDRERRMDYQSELEKKLLE